MSIVHKPISSADKKEGTCLVNAPAGAGRVTDQTNNGWTGTKYVLDTFVSNLPTTGDIDIAYSGRFDDVRYYTGDTPS